MTPKAQKKKNDARIERLYKKGCAMIPIDIFDISKVFKVGQEGIDQGLDDDALEAKIKAFVDTIKKSY